MIDILNHCPPPHADSVHASEHGCRTWGAATELDEKYLRRGTHRSTRQLEAAIRDYLDSYNEDPRPFMWRKSADEILASLERFCTRFEKARG
jgi:hypothetical protein